MKKNQAGSLSEILFILLMNLADSSLPSNEIQLL